MDKNKKTKRQNRTTYISPDLRKAQVIRQRSGPNKNKILKKLKIQTGSQKATGE